MRTHVFFIFFVLATSNVVAQSSPPYTLPVDPTNTNVYPPAPETRNFMQYGEYPVSRETGVPNISIPLHTVTQGTLSVPITLTYHASGIKVDQKASWVGLGWNLTSGGLISRTVKGHPDEFPHGYLARGATYREDFVNPTEGDAWIDVFDEMEILRLMAGERDLEPDEFSVNVPGYSGTFFLNRNNQPFANTQPYSDVKIEYEKHTTHPSGHIIAFTITTPDGIRYKFGQPSTTTYYPRYQLESVTCNSTWYLVEMTDTNGADVINFTYKSCAEFTEPRWMETEYVTFKYVTELAGYQGYEGPLNKLTEIPHTYSGVKVIDEILFNTGKVKFNSQTGRDDGSGYMLTAVDIYGKDKATVIKGYDFGFDYFNSSGSATAIYNKRLKLTNLTERGLTGAQIPPYEFTYLEHILPPRYAFSQDYWGYHNGKINGSLVPEYYFIDPSHPDITIKMGKANREPDAEYMKAGIIKKITYPTKGYTEFEFQANDVKRSYNRTNFTSLTFDAIITPTSSVNEDTDDIPEMDRTAEAIVEYEITHISGDPIEAGEMSVKLIDLTDNNSVVVAHNEITSGEHAESVELQAGHAYRLIVHSTIDQQTKRGMASIQVHFYESSVEQITENKIVGGLRVKSIKNFDADGKLATRKFFDYTHPDDPDFSSAVYNSNNLPDPANYLTTSVFKHVIANPAPEGGNAAPSCQHHEYTTKSLTYHASQQEGFPVGDVVTYEYVTEYLFDYENESNETGKVLYKYAVALDQTIPTITSFNLDRSWQRGQLLNEKHFSSDNQTVVKEVRYDYDLVEDVLPEIPATRINQTWSWPESDECYANSCECFGNGTGWTTGNEQRTGTKFVFTPYSQRFQWKRLASTTEILNGVRKIMSLSYEQDAAFTHSNVVAAEVQNSDGKVARTEIKYAYELAETELLNRNITGAPLTSDIFLDGQLTGGNRLTYEFFGNLYIPRKFEERLTDGTYSEVGLVDEVNAKGRITLSHNRSGIYTGILWGYQEEVPVAKITISRPLVSSSAVLNPTYSTVPPGETSRMQFAVSFAQQVQISTEILDPGNAIGSDDGIYKFFIENIDNGTEKYFHNLPGTKSAVINLEAGNYIMKSSLSLGSSQNIITKVNVVFIAKEVFHNSFEELGVNDPDAKTGDRVHDGDYVIHGRMLVPGQYVLSYFENTGTGWVMNKRTHLHDGASDIAILSTGKIDEVRIHPEGSQMETTTYDPVSLRVTSKTDANAITSYYFYDDLGRLTHISDDNKDIVGSMQYHYMND